MPNFYVKYNSVWKPAKAWVNVNGTWKKAYPVSDRILFGGGQTFYTLSSTIYYYDLSSIQYVSPDNGGQAIPFGQLTTLKGGPGAVSNGSNNRAVFVGGSNSSKSNDLNAGPSNATATNTMDYVTISTSSDAAAFGILSSALAVPGSLCNSTNNVGVFAGGLSYSTGYAVSYIEVINISTAGNSNQFNYLPKSVIQEAGVSNGINNRGVLAGGSNAVSGSGRVHYSDMNYLTLNSLGNAVSFGNISSAREGMGSTSNGNNTRGVFMGGYNKVADTSLMEYITIATTGNSQTFGNMGNACHDIAGSSNGNDRKGIFGGGNVGATTTFYNNIDYINISTPGNSITFANLLVPLRFAAATSNA